MDRAVEPDLLGALALNFDLSAHALYQPMKYLAYLSFLLLAAGPGSAADADTTALQAAIQKLAAASNYIWVSTPQSAPGSVTWRQGPTEGQTARDGSTYFQLTVGDTRVEVAYRGNKIAIKREDEWQGVDELTGDDEWIARRLREFKTPAREAADLLLKAKELRKAGENSYEGGLPESAVKELLALQRRAGATPVEISDPKGSVKFRVKDGLLEKYEFNLQGKVMRDQQTVEINRTTTVEIKNVGTTRVRVPDEAVKKL